MLKVKYLDPKFANFLTPVAIGIFEIEIQGYMLSCKPI